MAGQHRRRRETAHSHQHECEPRQQSETDRHGGAFALIVLSGKRAEERRYTSCNSVSAGSSESALIRVERNHSGGHEGNDRLTLV
jgi:ferredoxin-NADP reductase